jgi:hypothetical protein
VADLAREDLLTVLSCEPERRPQAPTIGDLAPHITAVRREEDALIVRFAPSARASLQAFVAAEQECCAGIGWQVSDGPEVALRIEAAPEALEALATMFVSKDIEKAQ